MMLSGEKNIKINCAVLWILMLLLLLSLVPAVQAQDGLAVTPSSIFINSTSGAVPVRTVVLNATQDIANLQFMPLDLVTSDGQGVIPEKQITANLTNVQMVKGTFQQVPITFDLGGIAGGQYSGEIWFTYANGSVAKIPVTTTVKAFWFWPLILLIITVLISYGLSYYNTTYKHSDEIYKKLDILEKHALGDDELKKLYQFGAEGEPKRHNKFWVQIVDTDIPRVKEYLELQDTDNADNKLKDLQTYWNAWQQDRDNLIATFQKFEDIINNLNALEKVEPVPIIAKMRQNLQDKFNAILSDQGQKDIGKTVNNYIAVYNNLTIVVHLIDEDLKNYPHIANCNACTARDGCINDMNNLKIDNTDETLKAIQAIDGKIKSQVINLHVGHIRLPSASLIVKKTPIVINPLESRAPRRNPYIIPESLLVIAKVAAFLVIIVGLTYVGYSQLYIANSTFGASLADWATLAVWGIMVGPSADAITQKTKTRLNIS